MSGTATVTVACRLPHGLYLDVVDPSVFDGIDPKVGVVARPINEANRVKINGCARPVGVPLPDDAPQVVGGFALTPGVPAAFWETWLAQNKDAPFVRNNLIFAHEKAGSVVSEAKEKKALRSGFEGMDPDKPAPGVARDNKKD